MSQAVGSLGRQCQRQDNPLQRSSLWKRGEAIRGGKGVVNPDPGKYTHGSAQDIILKSTYSNTLTYIPDRLRLRHAAVNVPPCQFVRKTLTYPLQTLLVASAHFIV